MNTCYVKAYFDWIEQTATLSDAERGRLFIAILEYARSGLEPKLDGREGILFPVFKTTIDRDNKKSQICAQNGKLGGRGNKASESQLKQNKANESEITNIRHKTEDKEKEKDISAFVPPSVSDVAQYCREQGYHINAESFVSFYASKGWMVGKNRMKDWKSAVVTWENRWKEEHGEQQSSNCAYHVGRDL